MNWNRYILILFACSWALTGHSQNEQSKPSYKHSISYFYPNYYYYDSKFVVGYPIINSGLKYSRLYSNRKLSFQTSLFFDKMVNTPATEFGETFAREVLFASFGLSKWIVSNENFIWDGYFELNGRFGGIAWLASQNAFESVYQNTPLVDLGASLGTNLTYRFNRIGITFDAKQSFYFLLYESGNEQFNVPSAPRHNLTVSIGVSCFFGKQD